MAVIVIACAWWVLALTHVQAAAPSAILLDSNTVLEGCPDDTVVGTLSAVDADPNDSFGYELIAGEGGGDNGAFWISGNQLRVWKGERLDFESQPGLSVRVRTYDSTDQMCDQVLSVSLINNRQEDDDGDGLSETDEVDIYGTSDLRFDTDGDGFGDGTELMAMTSPTHADDWPQSWIIGWGSNGEQERMVPPGDTYIAVATGQNHNLALNANGSVMAWGGSDTYGQTTVPTNLGEVVALAAGGDYWLEDSAHSLALKRDGTVVAWGYNHDGLITVPQGLDQVVAVAAGRTHCLALRGDGTVVTWGYNPLGSIAPPPGLHDVVAIAAGGYFSLALKSDGTVVAWGNNFNGTDWEQAAVPVGLADVVAISAGRFHSLALKNDGSVVAWGLNENGQASVPAGLNAVVAVTAGGFHSLALKNDGSVVAWGLNTNGQATVPRAAQGGVKSISAGIFHSLAFQHKPEFPEITDCPPLVAHPGEPISYPIGLIHAETAAPVFSAMGLPAGLSIDPHSGLISGTVDTATRSTAQIRVATNQGWLNQALWIGIGNGQAPTAIALATPGLLENAPPGTVVGIFSAVDCNDGDSHTFERVDGSGATDNASFRIEGNQLIVAQAIRRDFEHDPAPFSLRIRARDASLNAYDQIVSIPFLDDRTEDGDGDGLSEAAEQDLYHTSDSQYDSDGDGFGDPFEIALGFLPDNALSLPDGRLVVAWGKHDEGQTIVPPGLDDAIGLAAGFSHNLALKSDGTVAAWGDNACGQTTLPADLQAIRAVAAGGLHSLALTSSGTVVAWGNNDAGQSTVPPGLSEVVAISAGGFHNLALKADGGVVAWGFDAYDQATVPVGLAGVVAIAAGGFHSLALKSDGTVVAWGSTWGEAITVPEGLSGVIAIAAGAYHSLALKFDGTVVAWGSNSADQTLVPEALVSVTSIAAGWFHSLALRADGTLVTWGDNTQRQSEIPLEAIHIQTITAGKFHNLALRQQSQVVAFADLSPVRGWPGESMAHPIMIQNATPSHFSAMGLPAGLAIDPASGLVTGTVTTGELRAVRIAAMTDHGPLSRVIWFNTVDGIPPTEIVLNHYMVAENSPSGTVVATLSAVDPNPGDTHTFVLTAAADARDNPRFTVRGNQLVVNEQLAIDYETGRTQLRIRLTVKDSGNNTFEQDFMLLLTDDRLEDIDGDGASEMLEEDWLGTSDTHFEHFSTADTDQDALPNLIEYAFNLDPTSAGPALRLVAGTNATAGVPAIDLMVDGQGQHRLRIEYLRRVGAPLTYTPEFADGLAPSDWQPATQPATVTPITAEWERCVVEDARSTAEVPCRFGRVGVALVPPK